MMKKGLWVLTCALFMVTFASTIIAAPSSSGTLHAGQEIIDDGTNSMPDLIGVATTKDVAALEMLATTEGIETDQMIKATAQENQAIEVNDGAIQGDTVLQKKKHEGQVAIATINCGVLEHIALSHRAADSQFVVPKATRIGPGSVLRT